MDYYRTGSIPVGNAQDENQTSISIWRDNDDYHLPWQLSADEIERFVDAVGFPYEGAVTIADGEELIVSDVEIVSSPHFELQHIGKIFRLADGFPEIIYGNGSLRITVTVK